MMISYIHPCICLIDTRTDYILLEDNTYAELSKSKSYIHKILYSTDLPKCLELPNAIDSNPYHLLFYMISRFYFFDNGTDSIRYYYPKREIPLLEQALESLPSRFERIITKDETEEEYVYMPGCKWLIDSIDEDWLYPYVRKLYGHSPQESQKRIFISRKNASSRQFQDEEALYPALQERGFEILQLEAFSFQEQVSLFQAAEAVVGIHGAGLSWTVFCNPGTKVYEIPYKGRKHYEDIAKKCNLQYFVYPNTIYLENDILDIDVNDFFMYLDSVILS
jgi:hypothetical protein